MTSANNFRALFGLARPKLPFNFNILFKAVVQHGIDGGLIGAILLYESNFVYGFEEISQNYVQQLRFRLFCAIEKGKPGLQLLKSQVFWQNLPKDVLSNGMQEWSPTLLKEKESNPLRTDRAQF